MKYWKELNTPRDHDLHTLLDFMELLCLTHPDFEVSIEDLADHLNDFDQTISDDRKTDVIEHINWRIKAFNSFYPFKLERQTLFLNQPCIKDISIEGKNYLLLLIASNLPFVKKHNDFTESFERFSLDCLNNLWFSPHGKSVAFGKNQTEFQGAKHERLNNLFHKLGHKGLYELKQNRKGDSGDGGIDLAAWISFDEYEETNKLSIIVQCACSRSDILKKQLEVVKERFRSVNALSPWIPVLFSPVSLRDNHGRWAVESELSTIGIFDRLRLLQFSSTKSDVEYFPDYFDEMLMEERDITS